MSFRFGTTTRFKVTKETKTTWVQAFLMWYRAILLADIHLVSERLLCTYSLRFLIILILEITGANAISVDLDSSRVEQSIDQDETSAGNEAQIVNERIDRGGTTREQSSLFSDNGHLDHENLNSGLDHHLRENASDLDASGIEALRNTPEELFLLRHYSECIAPWYDLLAIHYIITS